MARKEAKLTSIQITQQLSDEMWGIGWDDEMKKQNGEALRQCLVIARSGNIAPLTDGIKSLLETSNHHLRDCYGILHGEDVREAWSEIEGRMVVEKKPPHGHWVLYFQAGEGDTLDNIAAVLGLPRQQLEKTQKGKYGYDNSLAYLVHIKYADKHQYKPEEVYTAAGRPYADIAAERWEAWLKGRSSITRQNALAGIDDLEQQILEGRVSYNQVLLTDEYYAIYARNKRRCDDAFDTYGARRAFKTIQAMENGEFRLSVFFLTGKSGDGKTRLAKTFIRHLIESSAKAGVAWRVCATAASNPMDEYRGEEILWMDDVRGIAMSASDWLKLLDPENASPASARYHNKRVACRCIVITSERDVVEFFYYCRQSVVGGKSEALDQFMRRIQSRVQVVRTGYEEDAPRQYRISDTVHMEQPEEHKLPGVMERLSTTYRFGDTQVLTDLDRAADTLVDRVICNNPGHWGEECERMRQKYETLKTIAEANLEYQDEQAAMERFYREEQSAADVEVYRQIIAEERAKGERP